jgi:hypothetical protein
MSRTLPQPNGSTRCLNTTTYQIPQAQTDEKPPENQKAHPRLPRHLPRHSTHSQRLHARNTRLRTLQVLPYQKPRRQWDTLLAYAHQALANIHAPRHRRNHSLYEPHHSQRLRVRYRRSQQDRQRIWNHRDYLFGFRDCGLGYFGGVV